MGGGDLSTGTGRPPGGPRPPDPPDRAGGTRRAGSRILLVLAALAGAWLAVTVAGNTPVRLGPVAAHASLRPSWTGDTVVEVPPLGLLRLDTHDGPVQLHVRVDGLDPDQTGAVIADPTQLRGLEQHIVDDARSSLRTLLVRTVVVGLLGGALLPLAVTRWPRGAGRRAGLGAGVAAVALGLSAAAGAATYNPAALSTPTYSGLLVNLPSLVGDVRSIVTNFSAYRAELARLVTNVSRLYETTLTLPTYDPAPDTVRLLVVSDIHLNPASWRIIDSTIDQFHIDGVVDAGDVADHGFPAENQLFVPEIRSLGVPYIYVRGNHDSQATAAAIGALPNGSVLEGTTALVDGIRILGVGDPRFTPDKDTRDGTTPATVGGAGGQLAARAWALASAGERVDVALVHDPTAARQLDGTVPLVIAGHVHRRHDETLARGTRLFVQGSTGGSGLRALEREQPTPVTLSVLYLDRRTGRLQAWDDISLGGLGESSATIVRHQVPAAELAAFRPAPPGQRLEPPPPSTATGGARPR